MRTPKRDGHYSEIRSFKASGGVPSVIFEAGLGTEREKIVAGGNIAIYAVTPTPQCDWPGVEPVLSELLPKCCNDPLNSQHIWVAY